MADHDQNGTPLKSLPYMVGFGPLSRELPEGLPYAECLKRIKEQEILYVMYDPPDDPDKVTLTRVDTEGEYVEFTSDIALLWGVYAIRIEATCHE